MFPMNITSKPAGSVRHFADASFVGRFTKTHISKQICYHDELSQGAIPYNILLKLSAGLIRLHAFADVLLLHFRTVRDNVHRKDIRAEAAVDSLKFKIQMNARKRYAVTMNVPHSGCSFGHYHVMKLRVRAIAIGSSRIPLVHPLVPSVSLFYQTVHPPLSTQQISCRKGNALASFWHCVVNEIDVQACELAYAIPLGQLYVFWHVTPQHACG